MTQSDILPSPHLALFNIFLVCYTNLTNKAESESESESEYAAGLYTHIHKEA